MPDYLPAMRDHVQHETDAEAMRLRADGYTFPEIAAEMGCSLSTAHDRVNRAWGRLPGPGAIAEKNRMLRELDELKLIAYRVLETNHVAISAKGIVTVKVMTESGPVEVPVPDDHPVLEAIDRLLKIQDQRAKLVGAYSPTRSRVEVITEDALDMEIRRLEQELGGDGTSDLRRPTGEGPVPAGATAQG